MVLSVSAILVSSTISRMLSNFSMTLILGLADVFRRDGQNILNYDHDGRSDQHGEIHKTIALYIHISTAEVISCLLFKKDK